MFSNAAALHQFVKKYGFESELQNSQIYRRMRQGIEPRRIYIMGHDPVEHACVRNINHPLCGCAVKVIPQKLSKLIQ